MAQRARAALRAASRRSMVVIFAALAGPPFKPPRRPKDTAAGSFPAFGSGSSIWPVAMSTIIFARAFTSVGRLRERSGIVFSVARWAALPLAGRLRGMP